MSAEGSYAETTPIKRVPTATTLSIDMGEDDKKWRDLPWAIAFYLHVLVVVIVAFAIGVPEISDDENNRNNSGGTTNDSGPNINGGATIGVLAAVAFIALFVSFGWIYLLMNKAKIMIQTLVIANIVVMLVGFLVVGAATGQWLYAIVGFGIPGAIILCWYFLVRKRIPFAAATLEVSCMAVLRYKCSFGFAFASLGVELIWAILWAVAAVGAGEAVSSFAITIILLISFYWTNTVIKNVLHTTVAGTVGTWWTQRDPDDPTWNAFKRAATKSFGSISFISLLIAIVKTMHYLAAQAQREAEGAMAFVWCIVRCIVYCLLRLLEYFSDYALVHVALYGKALVPAAKDTWNMFKERGWDAIINDTLIGTTLSFSAFIVGIISVAFGLAIGFTVKDESVDDDVFMILVGFFSFFIGFGMCIVMAGVIDSAVKTVFVCFGDAPEALRESHEDAFKVLYPAWESQFPEEMEQSGYSEKYQSYSYNAYTPATSAT